LRRPVEGWSGPTGGVDVGLLSVVIGGCQSPSEVDYFICGPPALVADAVDALDQFGASPDRIHTEQFDFA
jgi:ferredoxin-NADP reductase